MTPCPWCKALTYSGMSDYSHTIPCPYNPNSVSRPTIQFEPLLNAGTGFAHECKHCGALTAKKDAHEEEHKREWERINQESKVRNGMLAPVVATTISSIPTWGTSVQSDVFQLQQLVNNLVTELSGIREKLNDVPLTVVRPGDTVIMSIPPGTTAEEASDISSRLNATFKGNAAIVLVPEGIHITFQGRPERKVRKRPRPAAVKSGDADEAALVALRRKTRYGDAQPMYNKDGRELCSQAFDTDPNGTDINSVLYLCTQVLGHEGCHEWKDSQYPDKDPIAWVYIDSHSKATQQLCWQPYPGTSDRCSFARGHGTPHHGFFIPRTNEWQYWSVRRNGTVQLDVCGQPGHHKESKAIVYCVSNRGHSLEHTGYFPNGVQTWWKEGERVPV